MKVFRQQKNASTRSLSFTIHSDLMLAALGLRPWKRNLEPGNSNIIGAERRLFGRHMQTYIRTIFFEPKCLSLIINHCKPFSGRDSPDGCNIAPGTAPVPEAVMEDFRNFGQRFSAADFSHRQMGASCTFVCRKTFRHTKVQLAVVWRQQKSAPENL